jgi:ribose transport system substrate-binding protein
MPSRTLAARLRNPDLDRHYIIPVLVKAITIIRLLEQTERALNVTEVSVLAGVPKTTAYRILRTLTAYGYLPDGADGIYSFKEGRGASRKERCSGFVNV